MIIDLPVRPGLRILVTSWPVDFRRGMYQWNLGNQLEKACGSPWS